MYIEPDGQVMRGDECFKFVPEPFKSQLEEITQKTVQRIPTVKTKEEKAELIEYFYTIEQIMTRSE
jgi:hypothetical protein